MTERNDPPSDGSTPEAWPTSGVGARPVERQKSHRSGRNVFASIGFVLDAARRRRSGRMVLWTVVVAMALSGLGLLAYPFATDIWADQLQNNLEKQYQALDAGGTTGAGVAPAARENGSALTKMTIPRLGVKNLIVVEGITGNALRAGAGHYPNTSLPGDPTGNVAIAGHRTGFGQPFRHLEKLREGNKIYLDAPAARYVYEVLPAFDGHKNPWITHAKDWTVVAPTPEPVLTLTTCDPPGTSENRLIVRAKLVDSTPRA